MFHHKHTPLILSFALPIFMIIAIALSIFIPQYITHPQYNFIYSVYDGYYSSSYYTLENERLIQNNIPIYELESNNYRLPKLYLYDMKSNTSKEIHYLEAQRYKFYPDRTAPDGYKIENGVSHSGFLFTFIDRSTDNSVYAVNAYSGVKLNVVKTTKYWYEPIHFIGWIQQ